MFAALASAVFALGSALPADTVSAAPATPAIYAVGDTDTTIYIFGTFHVLDADIHWFDGVVAQSFERSDELVVETVPPARKVALQARPQPALTPVIRSASFLATTQMAVRAGQSQGMQLANGADMVLLQAAAAEGKRVEPLETIESQLTMLVRIPTQAASIPVLAEPKKAAAIAASAASDGLPQTMAALQSAWALGDQGVFADMLGRMQQTSPETYRIMFTERNARWADWIAARMRTPGTVFVAIGAGHLAGPDSLLVRLAQRGLGSRRMR